MKLKVVIEIEFNDDTMLTYGQAQLALRNALPAYWDRSTGFPKVPQLGDSGHIHAAKKNKSGEYDRVGTFIVKEKTVADTVTGDPVGESL